MLTVLFIIDLFLDKDIGGVDKEYEDLYNANLKDKGLKDKYAVGGKSTLSDKYKPKDLDTVNLIQLEK